VQKYTGNSIVCRPAGGGGAQPGRRPEGDAHTEGGAGQRQVHPGTQVGGVVPFCVISSVVDP
jgi:hypothetical protein